MIPASAGPTRWVSRIDCGQIPVSPAFLTVSHVAFLFESTKNSENGGVGELVVQLLADFCYGDRMKLPQDSHDIQLTIRKRYLHCEPIY